MKSKGIRILDNIDGFVSVKFTDILEEIHNGSLFHWSILYLDARGKLGEGKSIVVFCDTINKSNKGLFIEWDEINSLSNKLFEIVDILMIGCKDENLLHRYENDQKMYETCDIVVEFVDSFYWRIFSMDENLINRLAKRFKDIRFLETTTYNKFE